MQDELEDAKQNIGILRQKLDEANAQITENQSRIEKILQENDELRKKEDSEDTIKEELEI